MAARTLTYTINMAAPPKKLHVGLNTVAWNINTGTQAFGTLSDMYLLGKVPNGALITDADFRFGVTTQQAVHAALVLLVTDALGTLSAHATVIGSMTATQTAATTFSSRIPLKVSFSDDRAVQYATLALNVTTGGSESASFSFQGNIKFLTDGSDV
jgi:hypothetical protein